jgi:hypothetical protein
MASNERSPARLAEVAARAVRDPGSLSHDEIQALGGSVLTQTRDHRPLTEYDRLIADIDAALRKHYSPNDLAQYKPVTMADPLQDRLATTAKSA